MTRQLARRALPTDEVAGAAVDNWTVQDAANIYGVSRWGSGYFHVDDAGEVCVSPRRDDRSISLCKLVDELCGRDLSPPILIRFDDILRDRIDDLNAQFNAAIAEQHYNNVYKLVYPIKVNPYQGVASVVADTGFQQGGCIEAGSKPELLAAASVSDPAATIYCNGFKDDEFITLSLMLRRMGRDVVPIVEKIGEASAIVRIAADLGVKPRFGVRVKLASRGSGRWQASAGCRSKFGLTIAELTQLVDRLGDEDQLDGFHLLHFHIGSQIADIRAVKSAITEAARIYVDLRRRGAPLTHLDVGGGLGVDYDGTASDAASSTNYTDREYANDVVHHVKSVCDASGQPHPVLLSESGRAVTAHHSVLVLDVVAATSPADIELPAWAMPTADGPAEGPPKSSIAAVHDLWDTFQRVSADRLIECLHAGQNAFTSSVAAYNAGTLPLDDRVAAESLYVNLARKVVALGGDLRMAPDEIADLAASLSDIYFVNGSVFQSIPDSWAIDQVFPVMPLHQLDQRPNRLAVLGDITCDSDGKIDRFVAADSVAASLPVHPWVSGQRYRIGVFLIGAYQEILGDFHNLFGDTHAAHIEMTDDGPVIGQTVRGDNNAAVLGYVQYDPARMMQGFGNEIDAMTTSDGGAAALDQVRDQFRVAFAKAFAETTYLVSSCDGSSSNHRTLPVSSS